MRDAIADAGLRPDDIGYINAHGTGTPENDKMEWLGVSAVFGNRAGSLPMSSNKSMIGHTLSAAGAIEAAFTVLSLRHRLLPPTINYEIPDPALPLDCVPNRAREATVAHALSNSFGFGGQNVSLVFGAARVTFIRHGRRARHHGCRHPVMAARIPSWPGLSRPSTHPSPSVTVTDATP